MRLMGHSAAVVCQEIALHWIGAMQQLLRELF
jgi:hypothetical protein